MTAALMLYAFSGRTFSMYNQPLFITTTTIIHIFRHHLLLLHQLLMQNLHQLLLYLRILLLHLHQL
jgi:hypothetical protein